MALGDDMVLAAAVLTEWSSIKRSPIEDAQDLADFIDALVNTHDFIASLALRYPDYECNWFKE